MALFSRFSLRTNLILLIAVAATLLTADRMRIVVQDRNAAIAEARRDMLAVAERAAQQQASLISQAKVILGLASGLPEVSATSPTACQAPFRQIGANLPWIQNISIVDVYGRVICTGAMHRTSYSVADRPYFRKVFATRGFVLSDLLISRISNKPVLVAAMPRMHSGLVESIVLAGIDIHWLSEIAAETSATASAEVILFDSTGTVVANSESARQLVGTSLVGQPELWRLLGDGNGVFESADLDGEPRLFAHVRLPDTGAVLTVMRAREDVLGPVDRAALVEMAKIALAGLVCFVLVWFNGDRLVLRPIDRLTESAKRLGSGDLSARVDTRSFPPELRVLGATFNGMAEDLARHEAELHRANEQLRELATTDALTGLANRRKFDAAMEAEWQRACRDGKPVGLLIADVDHFKTFNDRYGHLEGDACLQQVATVLAGAARRAGELAGRTGGEEFAILLPGADHRDAIKAAEMIRCRVAGLGIPHADNPEGVVTLSIGVSSVVPQRGESSRKLLDCADEALYRAKRSGRNRVASDVAPVSLAS